MRYAETGEAVVLGFPTVIFRHRWPERETAPVNDALKAEILARQDRMPGSAVSNVGGWQSRPDLMSWQLPELERLSQWLDRAFAAAMSRELGTAAFKARYVAAAWANVNEYGDYNRTHIHSNCHWSGVYYVDVGRPIASLGPNGAIEFLDPRPAVGVFDLPGDPATGTWTLQPEAGLMLLFPGWLRHSVLPYYGEGARITIAFNLRVTELSLDGDAARP